MRILVVEDERKVASFIRQGLEEEGYAVDVLHDGGHAGEQAGAGCDPDEAAHGLSHGKSQVLSVPSRLRGMA